MNMVLDNTYVDETRVLRANVFAMYAKSYCLFTQVIVLPPCSIAISHLPTSLQQALGQNRVDKSLSDICRMLIAGFDNQRGQSTLLKVFTHDLIMKMAR